MTLGTLKTICGVLLTTLLAAIVALGLFIGSAKGRTTVSSEKARAEAAKVEEERHAATIAATEKERAEVVARQKEAEELAAKRAKLKRAEAERRTRIQDVRAGVEPPPINGQAAEARSPEDVAKDLERCDELVREDLAALERAMDEMHKAKASWSSIDRSVAGGRKANEKMWDRSKAVIRVYDGSLKDRIKDLGRELQAAPAALRAMAKERQAQAAAAKGDGARRGYLAMMEGCEVFAANCDRRYRELFADDGVNPGKAYQTAAAIEGVREMLGVHEAWDQTLRAWPTSMEGPAIEKMHDTLSRSAEDLETFALGMTGLVEAMKAKAAKGGGK